MSLRVLTFFPGNDEKGNVHPERTGGGEGKPKVASITTLW